MAQIWSQPLALISCQPARLRCCQALPADQQCMVVPEIYPGRVSIFSGGSAKPCFRRERAAGADPPGLLKRHK
jgi:hypothetical protein